MERSFSRTGRLLAFTIWLLLPAILHADNPNSILKKWNAIVVNNFNNVSEIEGRTFIGGNYSASNSHQFGYKLSGNPASDIVFAVMGSVSTNGMANIKVFNGSAAVSSSVSNPSWFSFQTSGGTLQAQNSWPQNNSPVNDIKAAADYWKTLPANSTVQIPSGQPGPLRFNCSSTEAVAVFNVTDTQVFENSKVQQFDLVTSSTTKTVIINVNSIDGNVNWTTGNMTGNFTNDYWRARIVWNVYTSANNGDMGTINFNSGLGGTLVAPTATLTTNSNVDGSVVVENLNIQSEIHNPSGGFSGNLPVPPTDCKNSLGGYVWHDKDLDGTREQGEDGIQGVTVELLLNNTVAASTLTDNTGKYLFTDVSNGSYSVRVAASNFNSGGQFNNSTQTKWYADNNVTSKPVTLNCADNLSVNLGFYKTGISMTKSADKTSAKPGEKITYSFSVENTGDVQHHGGVDIFDKMINPASPYIIYHIDILNPGANYTFTKEYTVKNTDCGELINKATAEGHPVDGSASVSFDAAASVEIDCSAPGATDWSAVISPDSAICEDDARWIPVSGSVHLTPNPSVAYLQTSWRIVKPDDGSADNSTHYSIVKITKDTSFSISAYWPGIRPDDKVVEIHYGVNVLDINGNTIKEGTGRDLYWYPYVCPPPAPMQADVKVIKTASSLNPACGENVTYTIKTSNSGPGEAKGVQVTELLPKGAVYLSHNASKGDYDKLTGLWTLGNLAAGEEATLTVTVKIDCDELNNMAFDLGIAKDYNLFVLQDASQPSSDTQGKAAIGRDASFGGYSVGDQLAPNSGDVLIVGRKLTFTSGRVYNGNAVYGDSTNLPLSAVSVDGMLRHDSPVNFASAKSYLENLSKTLSTYVINGSTKFEWGGLMLSGTDPYLNVFMVDGSDMSGANNFQIDVPNGAVVLVNISGSSVKWTGGLTVNGTAITNVLYNFYEAADLTIGGIDVRGSILAPLAKVNFTSGVQNGQMICKSLTGQGQFNNSKFLGNIPFDRKITNIASVSSSLTTDPVDSNNSSGVTITISSVSPGNSGSTGSGSEGSWQEVSSFTQGEIVYALANDDNAMYAGTIGGRIYKSDDKGKTWTRINSDMNVGWIWSLCLHDGILFAATEKGVYKLNGYEWLLTSLSGKDIHALVSFNGSLIAGTWGYGIYRSEDNASSWSEMNDGLGYYTAIQSLTSDKNGNLFAGSVGGGIFKLHSGESKWYRHEVGNNFVWALGSSESCLYAGLYSDGLYRSTDEGANWERVPSVNVPFIYSIVTGKNDDVYLSSWTGGVFVVYGNQDSSKTLGLAGSGVSSIIMSPDASEMYAGSKDGKLYVISGLKGTTSVNGKLSSPEEFSLQQNYPNPFNPETTIEFAVPFNGKYSLKVYNLLGQEIRTLINGELAAGYHKVRLNLSDLASGVYIYRLSGEKVNLNKKMLMVK
ncbi:MAG TPA: choice-of-anchor A family protein [Ignavibacteriales bacterium]|nr:choice-of-anchor A family protein [Ignavibacteriales bacterium]